MRRTGAARPARWARRRPGAAGPGSAPSPARPSRPGAGAARSWAGRRRTRRYPLGYQALGYQALCQDGVTAYRHGKGPGMGRVIVIGATGHIGTYLVPRLVRGDHEVIAMSRGKRDPYHPAPEWDRVTRVAVDRDAEDAAGTFGGRVAELQ